MHVEDLPAIAQQVKQQGRRDVVGQVADNAQPLAERRKIELECVSLVDRHVAKVPVPRSQPAHEVAVQLHEMQPATAAGEGVRDRALAGSNLYNEVVTVRTDRANDRVDHAGIGQEMLAKALPRAVPGHQRRAMCRASSTAASRLPGSAMPLPAMSNAVP